IGDRQGEAFTLNNLAVLAHDRKDLQTEERLYKQSLIISREVGDLEAVALNLGNLGALYADLNDFKKAEDMNRQSLKLNLQMGDKEGEGIASLNLANSLLGQHRASEAAVYMEQARLWFQERFEMMQLDARYQYELGNFQASWKHMMKAKEAAGDDWDDSAEQ